jgi:hypothetical protein
MRYSSNSHFVARSCSGFCSDPTSIWPQPDKSTHTPECAQNTGLLRDGLNREGLAGSFLLPRAQEAPGSNLGAPHISHVPESPTGLEDQLRRRRPESQTCGVDRRAGNGWFLRWLTFAGVGLFGLGFLIGSILAPHNPRRAGIVFFGPPADYRRFLPGIS